jgi:hypothetical protein
MRTLSGVDVPDQRPPHPPTRLTRAATTGDTVTVACKLPHGVILRVFEWEEFDEPMRDGTIRRGRRGRPIDDQQFTIRGTWVGSAGQAYHAHNSAVAELLPGGFALTQGVPKELWDLWHEQNRHSALVKNKIIFAHATHTTMQTEAAGFRDVKSGLEPLDPARPGERMPGGMDRRLKMDILQVDDATSSR